MRTELCRASLVATALVAAVPGLVQGQQAEFRAGIDLVQIGVTVPDGDGGFITDLTQDDFEIIEDGQSQASWHDGDVRRARGVPARSR